MDKQKINDFINVYSDVLNLSDEIRDILKELIPNLVDKYSKVMPSVSIKDDMYDKYLIKPVNGEYSLEDFFLNRLMLNVLSVAENSPHKGNYENNLHTVQLNYEKIGKQLIGKLPDNASFQHLDTIARKKVIMHEFEHALQSRFEGCISINAIGTYKKILQGLKSCQNGKYSNNITTVQELETNNESLSSRTVSVGLLWFGDRSSRFNENPNEIFNESESLEMASAEKQQNIEFASGNYYPVRNVESSNYSITNYGDMLKVLIGDEQVFKGMYLNAPQMFSQFNKRYNDIFRDAYGDNFNAWQHVIIQLDEIKRGNVEEARLKFEATLAKCFEKQVEKTVDKVGADELKKGLDVFRKLCMWNDDKDKRHQMEHIKTFMGISEFLKSKTIDEKEQGEVTQDHTSEMQTSQIEENQSSVEEIDETWQKRLKLVRKIINLYDISEADYQYERRADDEQFNEDAVRKIVKPIEIDGKSTRVLPIGVKNLISDKTFYYDEEKGENEMSSEYAPRAVRNMINLLKAADNLTIDGGKNFLLEFIQTPDVEYILGEMINGDTKLIGQLQERAEEAKRDNPSRLCTHPKTKGELAKEASTLNTERTTPTNFKSRFQDDIKKAGIDVGDVYQMAETIEKDMQQDRGNGLDR